MIEAVVFDGGDWHGCCESLAGKFAAPAGLIALVLSMDALQVRISKWGAAGATTARWDGAGSAYAGGGAGAGTGPSDPGAGAGAAGGGAAASDVRQSSTACMTTCLPS